jgi:hypothetical protein
MEFEGVPPLECSPPARRRRAAGEAAGSEESLLSEGTSAEAAWPRSQTVDGGRARVQRGQGWRKPRTVSWRILHGRANEKTAREYKEGICREEQQF